MMIALLALFISWPANFLIVGVRPRVRISSSRKPATGKYLQVTHSPSIEADRLAAIMIWLSDQLIAI
jgi:hypothetical protein